MIDITLIPGDGIGPEVTHAARKIIDATGIKINWIVKEAGESVLAKEGTVLPTEVITSIKNTKIAFKGPITTPIGKGFRSVNVALRKELDLFANVRPVKTYKGVPSRYDDIDLVVVRENTEDLYAGIEHMIGEDAAESIKLITRKGSQRIANFAFEYAKNNNRKKVTAVHKANIMKCTDGLFLDVTREIANNFKDIEYNEKIVDAMSMELVMNPNDSDVLVMPNLYGDILSDLCAGLVGGLGMVPSANIGNECAIFEPVHGSAPLIAGQNIANPTAAILTSILMLKYIGEHKKAQSIEKAITKVLLEGIYTTKDIGGNCTTVEFTDKIIEELSFDLMKDMH